MLIENKLLKLIFKTLISVIILFILLPMVTIIIMSINPNRSLSFPFKGITFEWFLNYFSSEIWLTATVYSFKIAIMTALLTTILGTLAAYSLTKGNFRGKDGIFVFLITPLIVPPMVLSISLYFFFSQLKLIGTLLPIVIGHTIISLPIVFVSISSSLQGVNQNIEKASRSLGASRFRTFFQIILPLILPGMISGSMFSFLLSFDELLIPMFLGGVEITTLPTHIWGQLTYTIDPTVSAVSSMIIISIASLVILVNYILKKVGN